MYNRTREMLKIIIVSLIAVCIAAPVSAGLKERRAVKEFQELVYPGIKNEIDKIAGFDVSVEVDWKSLAKDGNSGLYKEAFPKVYFNPLIEAFKEICADDMGKGALKDGLKKVVVKNSSDAYSPSKFSFKDGTLTIDHSPITNINDVKERKSKILKLLEQGL